MSLSAGRSDISGGSKKTVALESVFGDSGTPNEPDISGSDWFDVVELDLTVSGEISDTNVASVRFLGAGIDEAFYPFQTSFTTIPDLFRIPALDALPDAFGASGLDAEMEIRFPEMPQNLIQTTNFRIFPFGEGRLLLSGTSDEWDDIISGTVDDLPILDISLVGWRELDGSLTPFPLAESIADGLEATTNTAVVDASSLVSVYLENRFQYNSFGILVTPEGFTNPGQGAGESGLTASMGGLRDELMMSEVSPFGFFDGIQVNGKSVTAYVGTIECAGLLWKTPTIGPIRISFADAAFSPFTVGLQHQPVPSEV